MSEARAVVVTGAGVQCALGGAREAWAALARGETAVRATQLDGAPGVGPVAAAITPDVSPVEFLRDRKLAKYMSPAAKLAVVAAGRALRDTGLAEDSASRASLALFVATGLIAFDLASVSDAITQCRDEAGALDLVRLGRDGLRSCPPLMPFRMLLNMSLGLVSIAFGIRGSNFVTYPGADQAAACLEAAVRGVARGRFKAALVGGTAQNLSLMPLVTLMKTERLAQDPEHAIPYHPAHAGLAPSDGAAFLVLESMDAARSRGREPMARVGPVCVGRELDDAPAARAALLASLWHDACSGTVPARVLTTGTITRDDDERARQAAAVCWDVAAPALESYDHATGWLGAGSFPFTVAMAAQACAADPARSPVLVSAFDATGSHAAVLVSALPGVP